MDTRAGAGVMIVLAAPWLLWALPLPLLVWWLVPPHRERRAAVQAPFVDRLAEVTGLTPGVGATVSRRGRVQWSLLVVSWALLVLALARPRFIEEPITRAVPTRDLLLAVDLSGSMETADFTDASGTTIDRLTAVKQVLDGFLSRREGDRVGLIFFGSAAFIQAPFTDDLDVCRLLLDEAQVRMAGPRTVVGDAVGLAITVFEQSDLEERVLIVLTDGNDTGSRMPPERAAAVAADRGIVVHTVAVGDPGAAGEEQLDLDVLAAMAHATGGVFASADDRDELEGVYAQLDALDTREVQVVSHRPQRELFAWPLAGFLVLTMLGLAALQLPGFRRAGRIGP